VHSKAKSRLSLTHSRCPSPEPSPHRRPTVYVYTWRRFAADKYYLCVNWRSVSCQIVSLPGSSVKQTTLTC